MPGLPRPRLARVLRRRNRSDRARQRYALDLGALLALVCVIAAKWLAAVVVVAIAVVVIAILARRIVRRESVLAALGEECGVVVGSEGGEHGCKVTKSNGHGESAR